MDIYDFLTDKGVLKKEKDINAKHYQKKIDIERKEKLQKVRNLTAKNKTKVLVIKNDDSEVSDSTDDDYTTDCQLQKNMDNNRLKELLNDIDYSNNQVFISSLFTRYPEELEDYTHINGTNINLMKLGGYIRNITFDGELKFGGILIKIEKDKLQKMLLFLKNSNNNVWKIRYKNFHIFYKKTVTQADKFRKLFLTATELNNF